jgi:hypothetical protein
MNDQNFTRHEPRFHTPQGLGVFEKNGSTQWHVDQGYVTHEHRPSVLGNPGWLDKISIYGSVDLVFFPASVSQIVVVGPNNAAIESVEISLEDDVVNIGQNTSEHGHCMVGICLPTAPAIMVNDCSSAMLHNIDQEVLRLYSSGPSEIHAVGKARHLQAYVGGAGEIKAGGLVTITANLHTDGAGEIESQVLRSVQAIVNSAGSIIVTGSPQSREDYVLGAGKIQYL